MDWLDVCGMVQNEKGFVILRHKVNSAKGMMIENNRISAWSWMNALPGTEKDGGVKLFIASIVARCG
jgi:hypothetical protein